VSDILILSSNPAFRTQLEEFVRLHGARPQSASDVTTALEKMGNWTFDALFADISMPLAEQQKVADALWRQRLISNFVLVDLDQNSSGSRIEQRLFGAEIARGKDVLQILSGYIISSSKTNAMRIEEYPVWVVEDLDSPRDIICAFIEALGFSKVTGFRSAKETLAALLNDPSSCECIITDIRMPEFGGDYLIEQVRKHPKLSHLPILALTAYGSADTLIDCLSKGATGFLVKPPKREDLLRELGRAYRVSQRMASPRLASPDEIEQLRVALERRGFS